MQLNANYIVGYKEVRKAHLYEVNGITYPSVTKILGIIGGEKTNALIGWSRNTAIQMMNNALKGKIGESINITPEFLDWLSKEAKKEPQKQLEAAGDIGKRVHTAIDDYITGHLKEPLDKDVEIAFNSFLDWFKKNDFKFICGDLVVASKKYRYGGRLDALAKKGNKIILLDWKTSNAIRIPEYPLQVAAYGQALKETYSIVPSKCFIIRFGKETSEVEEVEIDIKNSWAGFKAALALSNALKPDLLLKKS